MDEHDDDRPEEGDDRDVRPLLSFDDGDALPHWSDPPTGEVPIVGSSAPGGGSRLFPQLPDDPNMSSAPERTPPRGIEFNTGSLADGVDDLAPTGPIEDIIPQISEAPAAGDELPAPRWADIDASVGSEVDADDFSSIPGFGGGAAETPASPEPAATEAVVEFDDDLDQMLNEDWDDDDLGATAEIDEPAVDEAPPVRPVADDGGDERMAPAELLRDPPADIVHPAAGPGTVKAASSERPDVALVRPITSAPSAEPEPVEAQESHMEPPAESDDDLGAWTGLDEQAPLWREGAQDWDDTRDRDDAAERTVLHFEDDDQGGPGGTPTAPSSGRNMPLAIGTAVVLIGAFLFLVDRGPGWALLLIVPLLVMAAGEFFNAVRHVGYRPATLLGLVAVAGLPIAAYYRGPEALPIVLMLTTVGGLLWYLFGIEHDRPTANLSVTLFGVLWVGLLGAYVPLILVLPNGSGMLLGAIIGTATYDTAGLFIGRWTGQSRLAPSISPNKTWEGLIGGMIVAVLVVTFVLGVQPGLYPWSAQQVDALLLGVVVAVMAPLGDLVQSLIKRDLGVKDMGTALPGHGGVFDRFDAMLFVLPAVYYLVLARDVHLLG